MTQPKPVAEDALQPDISPAPEPESVQPFSLFDISDESDKATQTLLKIMDIFDRLTEPSPKEE